MAKQLPQCTANVADGSKADVTLLNFDVRFTPESGHSARGIYEYTPSTTLADFERHGIPESVFQ